MTFSNLRLALGMLALAASLLGASSISREWQIAEPGYAWSFPRDHWAHPKFKTEWWYFTGHLHSSSDPERRFGYQFTFFRIGLRPESSQLKSQWSANSLIMGHAAISDLFDGRHVFSEVLYRAIPLLGEFSLYPQPLIAWTRAPAGTDARWTLQWNGQSFDFEMQDEEQRFGFQLSTVPLKPLIFQGPGGLSRKGKDPSAASHYYSFTRLATRGTLWREGERFQVEGESWMDKEFGSNQLAENQVGWDWFSLQLDRGGEIMLYHLRDRSGAVDFARGTRVDREGRVHYLDPETWSVQTLSHWTSSDTGGRYPSAWRVSLPEEGLELELVPEFQNQENRSRRLPKLFYWEGAVRVRNSRGEPLGRGYVELTGYGKDSRPPI